MIDNLVLLDPSDNSVVSIEWNGLGTATISSVAYSLPSPLTYAESGINNNLTPPITNLRITGVEHAQVYDCEAQVVLSTGEVLNRNFRIRGFNG